MAKRKTILPTDVNDYLSIISILGFLATATFFGLGWEWLNENVTALILLVGAGLFLYLGRVFTITKWARDGIQDNEFTRFIVIFIGFVIGFISVALLFGMEIPEKYFGLVGIFTLIPAVYLGINYIAKNTRK